MRFNKIFFISIVLMALLLVAGCSSSKSGGITPTTKTSVSATSGTQQTAVMASCTERWECDDNTRYFLKSDCTHGSITVCARGCTNGDCVQSTEAQQDDSSEFKIISAELEEEGDLAKTDTYELDEGEEVVIIVEGESVYVRVLVISEVDGRVKLKINQDMSFGIANGGMIVFKEEDDEEDEIIIEVVDVKIPLDTTQKKSVILRLAKIIK